MFPRRIRPPRDLGRVQEQSAQGGGKPFGIAGGYEDSCGRGHGGAGGASAAGHDRQSTRQRLGEGHAVAFEMRRQDEERRAIVLGLETVLVEAYRAG